MDQLTHNVKYFGLRAFKDTQRGAIGVLASYGRPTAGLLCGSTPPQPLNGGTPLSHSTFGVRSKVRNILQGFSEPCFSMPLPRRHGSGGEQPGEPLGRGTGEVLISGLLSSLEHFLLALLEARNQSLGSL